MLAAGTALGPYKIVAALGTGGMGEVYRAHDMRLGRDVAIKVLSAQHAATPEVRARFEREARTISQLSHPHICALYDVGQQDGLDYLVMELLEGETLAHRLEKGPLPVGEMLTLGTQIADALDAAHRAGIVHRDLKPGNIMLTKSGAKLMDFGLARAAARASPGAASDSLTVGPPLTAEGTIIGTLQYMAPEQLEGREADARTDVWALGCVLYEMATGKRAFAGASQAGLIATILKEEPCALAELRPIAPPEFERIVKRCLRKSPEERFQSARDLAFDLEGVAAAIAAPATSVAGRGVPARRALIGRLAAGLALGALLFAAGFFLAARLVTRRPEPPTFTRLTFQRGPIGNARFAPDGRSVIYGAAWEGGATELFETRTDLSTTRSLGLPGTYLQAVSRTGGLALARGPYYASLAIVTSAGSAPRDLLADVACADWAPDGKTLAVVRRIGGEDRLEMPTGNILVRSSGAILGVRVAPDGRRIAFTDHPVIGDGRGTVAVVDMSGVKTTLTREFANVTGSVWSPDGREIWFTATAGGEQQGLFAVSLGGRLRTVAQFPSDIELCDLSPDGRALLKAQLKQAGIRGRAAADGKERELGWLDWPWAKALAADGSALLLDDSGATAGSNYAAYLRRMDGSPPVRLGEGSGCALSPDGRWALAIHFGPPHRLMRMPTGAGDTLSLPRGRVDTYQRARFLPDGRRIVFVGAERGRPQRTWVQGLEGGLPAPVTPEGAVGVTTSPDGEWVATVTQDSTLMLFPLQGGTPRPVTKLGAGETLSEWSADGRTLFVGHSGDHLDVFGIDVGSGKRRPWQSFEMPDPAGVWMGGFVVTRDGRSYAYCYLRRSSTLYLATGMR